MTSASDSRWAKNPRPPRPLLAAICCGLLIACAGAGAQATGAAASAPEPAMTATHADNEYRAGGTVRIVEPIAGDLLAAGGRIVVERPVGRDAALAGGDVSIQAAIGDDLRAAGGRVVVDGRVEGDAHIAGGRVAIGRAAAIGGRAWLAGGEVEVLGRLPDKSRIYAGHAVLGGDVDGDLFVRAETIELQAGARIKGTLTYASPNPLIRDPAAQVQGGLVQQAMMHGDMHRRAVMPNLFGGVVWLLGLAAAAAVWTLLFPRLAESAQARLANAPGISLALGAAVFLTAPVLAALLLITLIGAPLALALLAAYGLVLLAGYLVVAGALGERLLRAAGKGVTPTSARRLLATVLAVVLLGLLAALPMLGWIITLLVLMAGTGALVGRYRAPPPAAAP